jgi:hypothetical protein
VVHDIIPVLLYNTGPALEHRTVCSVRNSELTSAFSNHLPLHLYGTVPLRSPLNSRPPFLFPCHPSPRNTHHHRIQPTIYFLSPIHTTTPNQPHNSSSVVVSYKPPFSLIRVCLLALIDDRYVSCPLCLPQIERVSAELGPRRLQPIPLIRDRFRCPSRPGDAMRTSRRVLA